jgi:hypothetical protein
MPASDKHDEAVEESFPASDPPASSGITGESDERKDRRPESEPGGDDSQPKGTPTSDRHATETAHQSEDQAQPT